jgi:hypothetical protein
MVALMQEVMGRMQYENVGSKDSDIHSDDTGIIGCVLFT